MINFFKKRLTIFLLVFLMIILLASYLFLDRSIKAENVYFYPQSCLGSFVNPEKAQGEPEVDDLSLINESNSAVYLGSGEFREIYCGNFQGPIESGRINKITLKLNLVLSNEKKDFQFSDTVSDSKENLIEKIIPSKEVEIINDSSKKELPKQSDKPTSSFLNLFNWVYAEESNQGANRDGSLSENQVVEPQAVDPQVLDNQNSQSGNSPSSQVSNEGADSVKSSDSLNNEGEEKNNSNQDSSSDQEVNSQSGDGSIQSQESSGSSLDSNDSESNSEGDNNEGLNLNPLSSLFDVFYTLDNQNWNYLGSINQLNWQNTNFEVPVNDWLLISKIQVKIQANLENQNFPYLYLESVPLTVEYALNSDDLNGEKEIEVENFPEINNLDFSKVELLRVKGISPEEVVAFVYNKETAENQLLLINVSSKVIKKIASGFISPKSGSVIGFKDNFIFWLGGSENLIFAADYKNQKIYQNTFPEFDKSNGQRAVVNFKEINYEVIYDGHDFYFKDDKYGEVFSDDYGLVLRDFRKNFNLDGYLSKEKLEELGFILEEE